MSAAASIDESPVPLAAGDTIRLASWRLFPYDRCTAEVGTARAYAAQYRGDPEAAHARARAAGHATAWTMYQGGALLGDAAARAAQARREDEAFTRARVVEHGQLVEIEGEVFRVRVNAGSHAYPAVSDPIAFVAEAIAPR